jgi:predicted transcriptional regulator
LDTKLVELLERNGLRRIEAKALAIFRDGQARTSMEIEHEAGLRQPEVSMAMPRMVGRGWFEVETVKAPGKGRPYFVYRLARTYGEICEDIVRQRGQMIAGMMADMNALRAVA